MLAEVFLGRVVQSRPLESVEAGANADGANAEAIRSARVVQGRTLKYSSKAIHHRPQMGYRLLGMTAGQVVLNGQEKKHIQAFMINLDGYDPQTHTRIQLPAIDRYRWCNFIDMAGHKNFDFKVTSNAHKMKHNTRNASMVEWVEFSSQQSESEGEEAGDALLPSFYGEI